MARVTVEDCVKLIPNRFDLVLIAAQRAKELASGAMLTVERDRDKNPVVALREIAEQTVSLEGLRDSVIRGMQKAILTDDTDEGLESLLAEDAQQMPIFQEALEQDFAENAEEAGFTTEDDEEEEIAEDDLADDEDAA